MTATRDEHMIEPRRPFTPMRVLLMMAVWVVVPLVLLLIFLFDR